MTNYSLHNKGFTLIELMIVMAIVALLITMVGPLAMNNLEKAQAKEEMLSLKSWLSKISYRAYATGKIHQLTLAGRKVTLSTETPKKIIIAEESFDYLFFTPQVLTFNSHGIVSPDAIQGEYKGEGMQLNLKEYINEEDTTILEPRT